MGLDGKGGYGSGFDVLRDVFTDIGVADEFSPEQSEPWSDFSCRHHTLQNGLAYAAFGLWERRYFELWTETGSVLGHCNVSLSLSLAMSFPGLRQEFFQNTELLELGIGSSSLGMGFFLRNMRGSTSL